MATRRKILRNVVWLAAILVVAGLARVRSMFSPQADQQIHVTEEMLAKLAELGAQPKYVAEPGTIYNGLRPEPDRLKAEAQLNSLIQRLGDGLELQPSKKFVLEGFTITLAEFAATDTEDRERLCRYLEEIMDILGIESSDGLLNRWLYGPILGPVVQHMRQADRTAM